MSITRLDAALSAAAATLAYSISTGSDRLLVVAISAEDGVDPDATGVDYGGQAMTKVRSELADPGGSVVAFVAVWYLLEAGIAAAVGTTITPTYTEPQTDEIIHAASYAGVKQTSPVVEHKGDNTATSTPNPFTTVDLVEASGNMIFAAGVIGEPLPEGVASWQADLTEQTDQLDSSSASSIADRLSTTEGEIQVELTWVGPVNRAAIISVHFAQVGFAPSCLSEVSATSSAQSSSTSYEVIPGMTLTPGGGDYLAWFTASVNDQDSLPESIFVALFVNGTIVAHTEREIHFDSSLEATTFLLAATHALVQPTDGQAVDVRWRTTRSGPPTTMTVLQRTLNLIKLDAAFVDEATATGDDTTTSTSYVLTGSMTITPGAGKYALFFTASAEGDGTDDDVAFAVFVGGAIVQHTERRWNQEGSITDSEFCYAIAAEVNPTAGQAVEIRWLVEGGTGTVHERTLTLWETDTIQEVSATGDTTTTSAAFALLDSMEITPDADEYLAIFTGYWHSSTPNAHNVDAIIVAAGTEIAHTQRTSGSDGSTPLMDHAIASNGIVTVNGSQAIEVHWRRSFGGTTTGHERTTILISCLAQIDKDAVDTLALEIDEAAGQVAVMIPGADVLALAILEGPPAINVEGAAEETLGLAILEGPPAIDVEGAAQDTLDLAIAEAAAQVAAGLTAEDTLELAIAEAAAQVAAGITGEDTLALAIIEGPTRVDVGLSVEETLALAIAEGAADLLAKADRVDTLALAILEAVDLEAQAEVADAIDLAIVEAAGMVAAGITAEDTLDLAIGEAAVVVASGIIEKVASDTLALAIVEAAAQVDVGVTAEETLALTIAEGVTDLLAAADPIDTTGLTLDELADLRAAASRLDSLDLSLAEVAQVVAAIQASDTLSITIDDAGEVVVEITASDALDLGLAELAELLALLGVSDTLSIVIDDAADLLVFISRSDVLNLAIDDVGEVAVQVTAADDLDLAIIEGAGEVVVGIVANDTLSLAIAEAADLLAILRRADTLNLALVEGAPVIFVEGVAEDTLDLAIIDVATVQVPIEASDLLDLAIDEVSQVVVAIQATDLLSLTVDEINILAGFLNRSDIVGLELGEAAQVAVFLEALDELDLAIDEQAAGLVIAIQAADTLGLSIAEFAQVFNALFAADTLGLAIDEAPADVIKTVGFEGIIVQPFTLVACREAFFTLEVVREVKFTLQIEGSGEQIP